LIESEVKNLVLLQLRCLELQFFFEASLTLMENRFSKVYIYNI